MPLADEIEDLATRIRGDLNAVHDYYVYTQSAWEFVRGAVESGAGESLEFRNDSTGTAIDVEGLDALGQQYIRGYLAESVFVRLVSLFEDFVFGLIRLWLTAHPAGIPNKGEKAVRFSAIVEARDRDEIILGVIDRELDALKYKRPAAWFGYLNDRVRLGGPSEEVVGRLSEMKATRDVIVHNRGRVNATYAEKSGDEARLDVGDRMEIPAPYLHDRWSLLLAIVSEMTASAVVRARGERD